MEVVQVDDDVAVLEGGGVLESTFIIRIGPENLYCSSDGTNDLVSTLIPGVLKCTLNMR